MSRQHENEHGVIAPIHADKASDAARLARHYASLYHLSTDAAYQKLGLRIEIEPVINETPGGGADICFHVTTKPMK